MICIFSRSGAKSTSGAEHRPRRWLETLCPPDSGQIPTLALVCSGEPTVSPRRSLDPRRLARASGEGGNGITRSVGPRLPVET